MEDRSFRFVVLSFMLCFVFLLSCIGALTEYGAIFGEGTFRSLLSLYFNIIIFPFVKLLATFTPLRGWSVFIIASVVDCLLYAAAINALIEVLRRRKA
jgi:hypothetical protein